MRTVRFPTLSTLRKEERLSYLQQSDSDQYDPFKINSHH